MKIEWSRIKWLRVLISSALAFIFSFIVVFMAITIYATVLAVQAQGPPDQKAINQFAQEYSPLLSLISITLLTLVTVLITNCKITKYLIVHGILIGLVVAIIDAIVSLIAGWTMDAMALIEICLILFSGFLGGWISNLRK
jgi:hypothetical protein